MKRHAVLLLALSLSLVRLAELTSLITLCVFAIVNAALWRLHRRDPASPGHWSAPRWLPPLGFAVSAGFIVYQLV